MLNLLARSQFFRNARALDGAEDVPTPNPRQPPLGLGVREPPDIRCGSAEDVPAPNSRIPTPQSELIIPFLIRFNAPLLSVRGGHGEHSHPERFFDCSQI
jgi:hypothetical protein